jgi:hypothetical protein
MRSNRRKPSTVTVTSRRSLSWRPGYPESGGIRKNLLLQHDNASPKPIWRQGHVANFGSAVHLFGPMKVGQYLQTATLSSQLRESGSPLRSMQAPVHRWRKWVASSGLCGTIVFCSWKLALPNAVLIHALSVAVSVQINRRHYFWSELTYLYVLCSKTCVKEIIKLHFWPMRIMWCMY